MNAKLFLGVLLMVAMVGSATAQPQRRQFNRNNGCVLNDSLTKEQKAKLENLRVAFFEKTKAYKNELNELMAKKRTLETTDPVDMKALHESLVSINTIQTKLQKAKVEHWKEVKSNLTDDQVVLFDSQNRGWMNGPGAGQGMGRGNRQGNGPGFGKGQGQGKGYCQGNGPGFGKGQGSGQGYAKGQGKGKGNGEGTGYQGGRGYGKGQGFGAGPMAKGLDLTDAQKEFMAKSRIKMMSEEQKLKNKLNELNARIKTLTTGKNIDLKVVDKVIDEKADITLKMAEIRADHRVEVRNQLTEKQKAMMDNKGFMGRGKCLNR